MSSLPPFRWRLAPLLSKASLLVPRQLASLLFLIRACETLCSSRLAFSSSQIRLQTTGLVNLVLESYNRKPGGVSFRSPLGLLASLQRWIRPGHEYRQSLRDLMSPISLLNISTGFKSLLYSIPLEHLSTISCRRSYIIVHSRRGGRR